jgi:hypothetical protein
MYVIHQKETEKKNKLTKNKNLKMFFFFFIETTSVVNRTLADLSSNITLRVTDGPI